MSPNTAPTGLPLDATPVIPDTVARSRNHGIASTMVAIGFIVVPALESAGPHIQNIFPHATWIAGVIGGIGALWGAYMKFTEQKNVVATNYSAIPGTPSASTHIMAEAVAVNPTLPSGGS